MRYTLLLLSILGLLGPKIELLAQKNTLMLHGGYNYIEGAQGSNLSFQFTSAISDRWSLGAELYIANAYNQFYINAHESRGLQSFMDIRYFRTQRDLLSEYVDAEFMNTYENNGLIHLPAYTAYSNHFGLNFIADYTYAFNDKWKFQFGFGTGLRLSDRTNDFGSEGGFLYSDIVTGIEINEEGLHFYNEFSQALKHLLWNSRLSHSTSFRIHNKISIVQMVAYQFDFLSATGIGGLRKNLGNAGLLQLNLGIIIHL